MSFWNRNKHKHDFGPWKIFKEFEVEGKPEPWQTSFGVEPGIIGRGLYQRRVCKDENCSFTELNIQQVRI